MLKNDVFETLSGKGTPAYIAPEILRREKNLTMSVDCYSFGITLYVNSCTEASWISYMTIEPVISYTAFGIYFFTVVFKVTHWIVPCEKIENS